MHQKLLHNYMTDLNHQFCLTAILSEPGLAAPSRFSSSICFGTEHLGISRTGFFMNHPTVSSWTLKIH